MKWPAPSRISTLRREKEGGRPESETDLNCLYAHSSSQAMDKKKKVRGKKSYIFLLFYTNDGFGTGEEREKEKKENYVKYISFLSFIS